MALLLDASGSAAPLSRTPLRSGGGFDERWLQAVLFDHPGLIPAERVDPGSVAFVPLAREFPLSKDGGTVFLDVLGVTATGRLMLVECKLWRNPQARREVMAQLLEYAALLRGWSYGDLTARLVAMRGWRGENPIYEAARAVMPNLDEAAFVDGVSRSLERGAFNLVIAGDGIRSDLQAMAAYYNAVVHSASRLSLLEVQLWSDEAGRVLVVPQLPVRTEVIEQRVLVGESGAPLRFESASAASVAAAAPEPAQAEPVRREAAPANRAFWQLFIDRARFDHPDQPPPRHGGNNWVRLDLPPPCAGITAYRYQDAVLGLFARFVGPDGEALFEALVRELDAMREESGLPLTSLRKPGEPFKGTIDVVHPDGQTALDLDGQIAWLTSAANRFVTLLRPRIAHLVQERAGEGGFAG